MRTLRGRDQDYTIGGVSVVLPPDHKLPYYQRRDPTYDEYAGRIVGELARDVDKLLMIDLGANVGDTAVLALASADNVDVRCVEGSARYAGYCRRNVARFGERATVIERFVGPVGKHRKFVETGTTAGFYGDVTEGGDAPDGTDWLTPTELLEGADEYPRVLWKTDIDGFDIHILVEHWDVIRANCEVLWFEFDPPGTLGDRSDIARLCELVGSSGLDMVVYDNLGRRMFSMPAGPAAGTSLLGLARWLDDIRLGHLTVQYLDVWLMPTALAARVCADGAA
ncbi:MAG: hypothetical protein WAV45_14535 [Propionibacteriaceae bacterium]|nr:hypothetical protein [Micropruina sp.]HBX80841.1 hypothetical protein [Propionibacteriaceae bacterium]HBY22709.1 hypothetical protein [Propionibacteriaceae bacterium]